MFKFSNTGRDWLESKIDSLTEYIQCITPSKFNEENRYLPKSVSSISGPLSYKVNPFMKEIVDCFDVNSPIREVNLKKGVQVTYSTLLESGAFYYMAHVATLPMMYITADKELALARIENNFLPMLNESGFGDIIQSSDIGNSRKTGKTKDHLQFKGGAYLVPFGAKNSNKMRQYSICVMLKDELDAWADVVGKDGNPDKLTDDRCAGYWDRRKIFRGSTPLLKPSKIERQYKRGDQRKYMVLCKACSYPQYLVWRKINKNNGIIGGFDWELDEGMLVVESVCYRCLNCGHAHYEHDKSDLFSLECGAHWSPTARPVDPFIRSYHLPAYYSPVGMQPWHKNVTSFLECFDVKEDKVSDITLYQIFINNVKAEPFEILGSRVHFVTVSGHRRSEYRLGETPNKFALEYCGSLILFLTCQIDVHDKFLAIAVMGWTRDFKCVLIEYKAVEPREKEPDCTEVTSSVWGVVRELLEETEYTADDGTVYTIAITFIDASYANDTVTTFCADYSEGVYPILGRDRPTKNQRIHEFAEFKTQSGTTGYRVTVDHYKDRIAPVLRRDWVPEAGEQKKYHFNAPVDISDKSLKELTVEIRREKQDDRGQTVHYWHRPGNARNELWDLLVYGHAAVEVFAWQVCVRYFEEDEIDWPKFWDYIEANDLFRYNKNT